jgi:Family of unknown function (DUF6081)
VTPKTQAPAAARGGFVTYDELRGPDLDAARWSPARLPLPTGGEHIPLDPNAELAVAEGEVRVTIPRFSLAHSAKYLVFSTRQFELPPDGPATFAVDMAVENIGGEPADYRRGMAAFAVFDIDVSKRVFSAVGTSTRAFAMHEQVGLGGGGAGEPFFHVVDRRTRTSTTTSPGFARARSRSTGADRPRPGTSPAARCTRPRPSFPNALRSGSGSGRWCRTGTVAVARSPGRA